MEAMSTIDMDLYINTLTIKASNNCDVVFGCHQNLFFLKTIMFCVIPFRIICICQSEKKEKQTIDVDALSRLSETVTTDETHETHETVVTVPDTSVSCLSQTALSVLDRTLSLP